MDLILICLFGLVFIFYITVMLVHPYYVENRHRINETKNRYGFHSQKKRMILFILLSVFFFLGALAIIII